MLLRLLLLLSLLLPLPAQAANSARNFAGGASTDVLTSGSTITPPVTISLYARFNVPSLDATTRRLFEWGDNTADIFTVFASTGNWELISNWTTTAGDWTIVAPSTGVEHDLLITYNQTSAGTAPIVYLDGSSVTVTQLTASAGTRTTAAKTMRIGNRLDGTRAFNGWISTFAIWNTILTSGNATTLHGDAAPCTLSSGLLAYWPINAGASPETETVSSNTLTVTGTTVVSGSTVLTNPLCTAAGTTHNFMMLGVGN